MGKITASLFIECKLNNKTLKTMVKLYTATLLFITLLVTSDTFRFLLVIAIVGLGVYTAYRIIRGTIQPSWLDPENEISFGTDTEED